MSRCYPFPPPGYAGKFLNNNNEALIDSIKLQEERENTIPDRVKDKVRSLENKKERKRDKKEKKKERKDAKKDEKKSRPGVESEKQQYSHKLHKVDSVAIDSRKSSEALEALERSNLTEEYGRPVDSQNVPCSSDSTGNSGKRKRHSSPASTIQGHGNIIRIRLSSHKRDDVSKSLSIPPLKSEDHSTSQGKLPQWARSNLSINQTDVMSKVQEPVRAAASTSTATLQLISREDNSHPCLDEKIETPTPREDASTSGRTEIREPPPKKLSSHERKMLKKESLYNNLFQNLVAPALLTELVHDQDDEDDWLFGKNSGEKSAKRLRGSDDMDILSCSASAVIQPRAHFLSDVGVYALPFTVPF